MAPCLLAVFDLDGTLVDSAPDIHAALDRLMARLDRPPFARQEVVRMIGDGVRVLVERALAARGLPFSEAALAGFTADYTARAAEATAPFPGIPEALTALAAAGWRLAVCTNKPVAATLALLRGLGIEGRSPPSAVATAFRSASRTLGICWARSPRPAARRAGR
ncbi:HAD family hydrolase [Siccirubricoccus deserti]